MKKYCFKNYTFDLGIPPGVPTMKGAYGDPENTGVGYNTIITELGDHSVPKNWEQFVVKRGPGETPGPPIIWSDPQDPEDAQPGYGFIADDTNEEETFFYHSDHLGSTSYITDQDGNITQYTAYLPYGELLVDEHSSSEELPYKFNGKELDEETGLYYYGARYLNPTSSVWYGVDPLMEKYPHASPYVYCANNPIRYIDPTGMFYGDYYNLSGKKIGTDGIDDEMKYLVLDSDEQKAIRKRDKQGETTQLGNLSSAINVPPDEVISAMEQSFSLTERNGLEHGFRVGMKGTVTSIISGTETEISDWSKPIEELKAKGEYAAYEVHSHPLGDVRTTGNYGVAEPSNTDKQNIIKSSGQPSVVLGYKQYQIGGPIVKSIGYYNSNGLVGNTPIPFNKFINAVNKINRMK